MSDLLSLLALGAPLALGSVFLAWLVFLKTDNAGWVDVSWALGLGALAVAFALAGPGDASRRLLLGLLGGTWALRLGLHLAHRVATETHEDGRYTDLRQRWGGNIRLKFLGFFLLQGAFNLVLATPFFLMALDPRPGLSPLLGAGAAVLVLAVLGEGLADRQLRAFKADPDSRGQVCRRGLWGWSRHPNYFFEWLVWVGWLLMALPSPHGWLALVSPLLILHVLLKVTGIPATEAQALRSRGEAYARYQTEVSPFIPLPPRSRS